MTIEDCYLLGKVTKTHGLKGEVIIWLDVDEPEDYADMDSLLLLSDNGDLVPYFLEHLLIRGKKSIAKFEDIDRIEDTDEIMNKDIYLTIDNLPDLDTSTFYYHEVPGFELKCETTGEVYGKITHVYEGAGQDLIAFEKAGKEVLVPISNEIVKDIDRENKVLFVNLPEGLIDVYME